VSDSTKALATALARFDEAPKPNEELSMRWYRHDAGGILAALPPDAHLFTVDSLAAAVFAADDPHFRFATRGNCERFADAIIKAAKEASE